MGEQRLIRNKHARTFKFPNKTLTIVSGFLFGTIGIFFLVFAQSQVPPVIASPEEYAPSFRFDSEENYYPADPLNFYYDENLNELDGEVARQKYDQLLPEEKLKNSRVFYKIENIPNEIIYQYWLFYVFNEGAINEHYRDWEFIFVFVDKKTKKVNRIIGSAHIGSATKVIFANNELQNPKYNHTTILVERGSHANTPDGNGDGLFTRIKDITNWYDGWGIREWSSDDRDRGVRIFYDSPHYKLVPAEELKGKFLTKYDENRSLLTKEKSPTLGALPVKWGEKKIYAIPFDIAGAPAGNIWTRPEYRDSYVAVPLTGGMVAEKVRPIIEKTAEVATWPMRAMGESIAESMNDVSKMLRGTNPFRAGIVDIVADINTKKETFGKKSEEIASQVLVDVFIGDPTRIVKEQVKNAIEKKVENSDARIDNFAEGKEITSHNILNKKEEQQIREVPIVEKENEVGIDGNNINGKNQANTLEQSDVSKKIDQKGFTQSDISVGQNQLADENQSVLQNPIQIAWQPPPMPPAPPVPQVTSHVNDAQVIQSQVTIVGTASPGIWVIIDKGLQHFEAKTNESGTWSQNVALNSGSNTFSIKGRNLGSVESAAISFALTYGAPPTATISLANYKIYNLNFTVQWSGNGQNVLRYDVQYKEGISGNWQNWILNTADTSKEFSAAKDNVIYYFRVRAVDQTTLLSSDWMQAQAEIMQMPVVINEIAWMGTNAHFSDEWIELYNRSNTNINLAGWALKSTDGTPNITLSGTINPNGYYLFERTADTTISDATADQIYTGALSDSIEVLELLTSVPENKIIDRVSGWYAGSLATRSSMERINPAAGGDTIENWATNNGVTKNGIDAAGNPINGTPRAQNSAYNSSANVGTYISDTTVISVNTIWSLAASPYLLMSNSGQSPKVASGVTLTIEPGVIIKPLNKNYTALEVQGTLAAQGTSASPVKFTSKEAVPAAGDFGAAILFTSSSQNSSLKHVTFEYGGYFAKDMVKVDGSKVVFDTVTFKKATGGIALSLKNSTSEVLSSIFQEVQNGVVIEGVAGASIQNSSFTNVTIGIRLLAAAKATVSSNSFSQNGVPIDMRGNSLLTAFGNSAVSNGSGDGSINGILVTTSSGEEIASNVVWKADLPYVLVSNSGAWLTILQGATLTLEPGVVVKPKSSTFPSSPYNAIEVKGNLIAQGTQSQPIVITSFRDDNALYGGDTNNDGTGTAPAVNDWHKILIKATSSGSNLSYMKIRYGGSWSANPLTIEEGASVLQANVVIE